MRTAVNYVTAAVIVACGSLPARSQDAQVSALTIQLVGQLDRPLTDYRAELASVNSSEKIRSAAVLPDHTVRLADVPYGDYWLTIFDESGAQARQQMITVSRSSSSVVLRLPEKEGVRPPGGPISVSQLRNPPPKKALRRVAASQKFFDAGDYDRAAAELNQALQICPTYADAYSNLAIVHLRTGLYEQALADVSRALELGGPNARDLSNRALTEYQLRRYAEAAQSAQSALHLDPNYDTAHYVLGVVLAMDRSRLAEALPHLERAARTFPSANASLSAVRKALLRP